ncbi:src like adaptor 1a [Entelurus aequoreus]|uniref:src like adaptor 1a n=1 Tax=Entelurus aequoreus TaxID=161455 RepID=UPI002B1E2174|nr:src like adaptor 1a [Entelurus aequoreus]XP_061903171.1 src like adaptor 1a [Entelurus aequoreus]XP_061903173.1 src like adaptor 1a [Entelurus aequoreus]XP_061903174.1 src like adaptor 1a [Entelurus aequoreus]
MGNVMRGVGIRPKVDVTDPGNPQRGSEDSLMVVLTDYPSPDIGKPIFKMGEKLSLISQDAYWWKVSSIQTGKKNYIPDSHVAKVYHGWLFEGVTRQKAEELLLLPGNVVGSFLVRESSVERGMYVLSIRHSPMKHYRIYRLDNSWYYISPRLTFQCLEHMINYYSDFADGLCCVLTSPCLSDRTIPPAGEAPVVMKSHFDWNKINRTQLTTTGGHDDDMVSYGIRNSMADHLSFSRYHKGTQGTGMENRKKKSRSVYALPENGLDNIDYDAL